MTTAEALLAIKIGCKIRADWMKPELFYYTKGDNVCCDNTIPPGLIKVSEFCSFFDDSHNWYIV